MKFSCFFRHNWKYSVEDITYTRIGDSNDKMIIPTQVRLCSKCYKKQRSKGIDWTDWELSVQEERDKKLREIGI